MADETTQKQLEELERPEKTLTASEAEAIKGGGSKKKKKKRGGRPGGGMPCSN